jgi:hypothetical protein
MTKTDVGLMAKLPTGGGGDELKLPRALVRQSWKECQCFVVLFCYAMILLFML